MSRQLMSLEQMVQIAKPLEVNVVTELPKTGAELSDLYVAFTSEAHRLVGAESWPYTGSYEQGQKRTYKSEVGEDEQATVVEVSVDRETRNSEVGEFATHSVGPHFNIRIEGPLVDEDADSPTRQVISLAALKSGWKHRQSSLLHSDYRKLALVADLDYWQVSERETFGWVFAEGETKPEEFAEIDNDPATIDMQRQRFWVATQIARGLSADRFEETSHRLTVVRAAL